MKRILRGFVDGDALPPVVVEPFPQPGSYRYLVHNGLHRFYASVAVGFTSLPVAIKSYSGDFS